MVSTEPFLLERELCIRKTNKKNTNRDHFRINF